MSDRPSDHRENVFDTEDGIRLIISKDKSDAITSVIHFSGSVTAKFDKTGITDANMLAGKFVEAFRKISGDYKSTFRFVHLSDKGVPHFVVLT